MSPGASKIESNFDVIIVGSGAGGRLKECAAYYGSFVRFSGRGEMIPTRNHLGYIGNVPLAQFDGPPNEMLRKLGLTKEPA